MACKPVTGLSPVTCIARTVLGGGGAPYHLKSRLKYLKYMKTHCRGRRAVFELVSQSETTKRWSLSST